MRRIKFNLSQEPVNGWDAAIGLTEGYLAAKDKADRLLDLLPPDFIGRQRARCQSLFLGALRHGQRARYAYRPLMRRVPRPRLEAILLVTAFELQSEPAERQAKIVHHAVERSKAILGKPELGFLNAVLRQLPEALRAAADSPDPAVRHSHPDWLVAHWLEVFGPEATEQLLQWNQGIPPLYPKVARRADRAAGLPRCDRMGRVLPHRSESRLAGRPAGPAG